MEFIPLEQYSKKSSKRAQNTGNNKVQNLKRSKDLGVKKRKPQIKAVEKKDCKNKFRETSELKKKYAIPKRRLAKRKNEEGDEEDEDNEENEENEEDEENEAVNIDHDENDGEEENKMGDNQDEEDEEEDKIFKKKCKELDDKKKNRLFVKLKKKIYSETQIKELHPDVQSVIFPRKKKSRWCWAVFASEEKAERAMKNLIKNKDIFVNKPNPYEKVVLKRKKKLKTVLRKKEARKKLQKMWM